MTPTIWAIIEANDKRYAAIKRNAVAYRQFRDNIELEGVFENVGTCFRFRRNYMNLSEIIMDVYRPFTPLGSTGFTDNDFKVYFTLDADTLKLLRHLMQNETLLDLLCDGDLVRAVFRFTFDVERVRVLHSLIPDGDNAIKRRVLTFM